MVMAAYRTPRDKVACVTRCALIIMDLLSVSCENVPTADDFTPVLVYIIVKVILFTFFFRSLIFVFRRTLKRCCRRSNT